MARPYFSPSGGYDKEHEKAQGMGFHLPPLPQPVRDVIDMTEEELPQQREKLPHLPDVMIDKVRENLVRDRKRIWDRLWNVVHKQKNILPGQPRYEHYKKLEKLLWRHLRLCDERLELMTRYKVQGEQKE